jgi:hypothetical protein
MLLAVIKTVIYISKTTDNFNKDSSVVPVQQTGFVHRYKTVKLTEILCEDVN